MAKILIVEDDAILQSAYNTVLSMEGYEVVTAPDGAEAFRLASESSFDLILLDMLMPNMTGLQFLRVFKPKEHPHTKIIVFSNVMVPEDMKEAIDLGAAKYLTKATFTPKEMVATIKEVLAQPSSGGVASSG
jgi:DNA-binding response OmpR family regulator